MTPPSSILTNDHDRASATAWGTLSLLVLLQVGLVMWLLATHSPESASKVESTADSGTVAVATTTRAIPSQPPAPTPRKAVPPPGQISAPVAPAPVISSNGPPPVGSFGKPTAPPAPPVAPPTEPPPELPGTGRAPPSMPPLPGGGVPAPDEKPALPGSGATAPDEKPALPGSGVSPPSAAVDPMVEARRDVNGLLTSARELRGLGNTQDALELLQHADLVAPNHPAVLAETAEVYEQMGLNTKAVDTWRSIQLQGEAKAGQYYELAVRRLGSVPGAATTAPSFAGSSGAANTHMRLGACKIQREFEGVGGERFVLRVPLQRAGNRYIDPNAIDMKVFFYYRQNGRVSLDNVTPLTETWQTEPVDWNGAGEEIVDVVYHLPPPTAAEITQRSQKSYHGYMLHLYYDNKLQDVAAEPRDLLDAAMASRGPSASDAPNPLLPPVGR